MAEVNISIEELRQQILTTEKQLAHLKEQLQKVENHDKAEAQPDATSSTAGSQKWPLTQEEYNRYGRQMIMPTIGLKGKNSLPRQVLELMLNRSTSPTCSVCLDRWCRGSWMSSSSLYCCCWCQDTGYCRWRYG